MSSNAEPQRKRARTQDDSAIDDLSNEDVVPQPDEEFWALDGTVILVAGKTKFRVYRGILTEHSTVFSEMFALPQPESAASEVSSPGCPVVELQDSEEDIRCLLRLLIPRRQNRLAIHTLSPRPSILTGLAIRFFKEVPPFDDLSAYVRLGHKYQIEDLLEQSLQLLERCFPHDYKHWVDSKLSARTLPPPIKPVHAISVVHLARLTGRTSILPLAFAYCSTLGAALVQGYTRPDGTHDTLDLEDLDKCLKLAPQLAQANLDTVVGPFIDSWKPCPKCEGDRECVSYAIGYLSGYTGPFQQVTSTACKEIFPGFEAYFAHYSAFHDVCLPCREYLKAMYQARQRRWWEALPEMAGVEEEEWR